VHGDELILPEQQRVEAGVGIELPQLRHRAADRLGQIRCGAAVLADHAEVALTVRGAAQRRGDTRVEQLVQGSRRFDGPVVRHRNSVGDEGVGVLSLHRQPVGGPPQVNQAGHRTPHLGGRGERGVVQRTACRDLHPWFLLGLVYVGKTPAVAVDLGQRHEVLQHVRTDCIRDGDRCRRDDTQ
jgi:hypothetical protein